MQRDADGGGARLQNSKEFQPADRGKSDAVDLDALPAQIERDVLPAFHSRRDCVHGVGVVGTQEFERGIGEHHPETPCGARRVLLEQIDRGVRMAPLPQIAEIEAAGAPAGHGDSHDARLPDYSPSPGNIVGLWPSAGKNLTERLLGVRVPWVRLLRWPGTNRRRSAAPRPGLTVPARWQAPGRPSGWYFRSPRWCRRCARRHLPCRRRPGGYFP